MDPTPTKVHQAVHVTPKAKKIVRKHIERLAPYELFLCAMPSLVPAATIVLLALGVFDATVAVACLGGILAGFMFWHERRHDIEKKKRAAMDLALSCFSVIGAFAPAIASRPDAKARCPICKGTGRIANDIPCSACGGDGLEREDEGPEHGKEH